MSLDELKPTLAKISRGEILSVAEAEAAFTLVMGGKATPAQVGALLMGLRVRGEATDEIRGAATAMRQRMISIASPPGTMDIVGTGGDNSSIYNVSTASCLVVSACGIPVAKHGGRSVTSSSGASDVLEALGVNLQADFKNVEALLSRDGIAFLPAPRHHPAMKINAPIRQEIGTRTIFNLLGPLTNPAGAQRHLIGVYDRRWLVPFAEVLRELGSDAAWIVHGSDGLDEVTTTGPTYVAELKNKQIRTFEIHPEEAGLFTSRPDELKGGDPTTNAAAMKALLAGAQNAYRNIVLFNAAAALMVADKVTTLREGAELARQAIDSGKARLVLEQLVRATNEI